jgi:hypothetical protein
MQTWKGCLGTIRNIQNVHMGSENHLYFFGVWCFTKFEHQIFLDGGLTCVDPFPELKIGSALRDWENLQH